MEGQVPPNRLRLPGTHRPHGGPFQVRPKGHHGGVLPAVRLDGGFRQGLRELQPLFATGGLEGAPPGPVPTAQDAALPGMTLILGHGVDRHLVDAAGQLLVEIVAPFQGGHRLHVASQPGQDHDLDLGEVADPKAQPGGGQQQRADQAGQGFQGLGEQQGKRLRVPAQHRHRVSHGLRLDPGTGKVL